MVDTKYLGKIARPFYLLPFLISYVFLCDPVLCIPTSAALQVVLWFTQL